MDEELKKALIIGILVVGLIDISQIASDVSVKRPICPMSRCFNDGDSIIYSQMSYRGAYVLSDCTLSDSLEKAREDAKGCIALKKK